MEAYLFPGAGSPEALREVIAGAEEPEGLLVIETDGEPAGALELTIFSRRSGIGQLSRVMVAPARRGAGIGCAAVTLACRYAFEDWGLHRMQAEVYGDNLAGQRLFEAAGFTREGVRRQAYRRRESWLDGILFGRLAGEPGGP